MDGGTGVDSSSAGSDRQAFLLIFIFIASRGQDGRPSREGWGGLGRPDEPYSDLTQNLSEAQLTATHFKTGVLYSVTFPAASTALAFKVWAPALTDWVSKMY